MSFVEFVKAFHPVIQYFGTEHFPKIALERIHFKCRDLSPEQISELFNMIMDTCEYAPKVPKIIELANIIRARHREGIRGAEPERDEARTDEVAQNALAQIRLIFSKTKTPKE
jgi:hypothetical protein